MWSYGQGWMMNGTELRSGHIWVNCSGAIPDSQKLHRHKEVEARPRGKT